MAWGWTILRAAVEQEILFPSEEKYNGYIDGMTRKGEPFEVESVTHNDDGTLTVLMRKRYNPHNAFLRRGEK